MDRIITTAIFLSVFKAALCFNIDPVAWKSLSNSAAGFGYQVVQRQADLLVSAPLEQYSPTGRGQIYTCNAAPTASCTQLRVQLPEFAVNTSLGLTMINDPRTQNTLACGPTIPKDCTSITMYNGICLGISRSNGVGAPKPSSLELCRSAADIAFLLDGSGSVAFLDFQKMKKFVKDLVRSFKGKETQFAISQFSSRYITHYFFNTFDESKMETQIDNIRQLTGGTYTATAIEGVVREVFREDRGSRPNVRKILVVITDGESQQRTSLPFAVMLAEQKKIVRFAIGVGNAFSSFDAKQELNSIASDPPDKHVFRPDNFNALEQIRQSLQDKIFSIEGSKTSGETLKMEMSQEGFSAAYVSQGIQMAVVGANQWKGGYLRYTGSRKSSYEPQFMKSDSYLGYSMAVAKTGRGELTIVGAPRYDHQGVVMTIDSNSNHKMIEPFPSQSGQYFGAEVCAMDVDHNGYTDLILISAPMYVDSDREGRVYICSLPGLNNVECEFDSQSLLRGAASNKGRFGSSLAVLPDLNTDGFNDLAVGAPLENDGQGSIYIFHSEGRKIGLTHSQRIAASEVQSGLKFFGMSISQSSFDHSSDSLPDLAVGSKGVVVILRSKPIVMVEATVLFSPNQIPIQNTSQCSQSMENKAQICFIMSKHSEVTAAQARINFTLILDATRKVPNNRAYISDKQRMASRSIIVSLGQQKCEDVDFFIEGCPEDALNALTNELKFTFDGLPSNTNLSPSLAQQAETTTIHYLGFEINCGSDNECVDNLKVDFNFTSSSVVKVGIDDLLDVTVSVENRAENSYNSRVVLTYPPGLSYRKFTVLQGRIDCNSEDSIFRGKTDCTIDKPIFKSNTKALFIVSYGIDTDSQLDSTIYVTANATSGNQEHSTSSQLYRRREIDVKYSIFVTFESRLSYYNFTFGKNDLQKPVQQEVVVTNDIRVLNFTVVIKVPVKLGDKDIWVDSSSLQFPNCRTVKDAQPNITDFVAEIQKTKIVDCSVAKCRVFKCSRLMGKLDSETFKISANLSSGWIEQIGLQSAKFLLTSTASMEYDKDQYIFALAGSSNNPPVRKIEAEVEVYPEPDFTKEIVGGSVGGLALLALLTAGLYKAGFFKSKYKDMINEAADAGADGGEPMADQSA